MPDIGDTENKYNRNYIYVNPDSASGPPTWRASSPQEIGTPGSGGGGGTAYDFESVSPVVVNTTPDLSTGRTSVETSMDITRLGYRTN